ncbi:MAG TPA: 5'/3'-nucleotidase SurE [Anaerolineae bacterium]|nr:5'/3'-nucleotidase SurE [Anaerolineae bacterium]
MAEKERPLILLTNDDGIQSPGLWAAAEALSPLGYVTVAAPREQCSGCGRSMPPDSEGSLREETVSVRGKEWKVYAVGGSPAQAVLHAILELMPRRPDLVVAGINYGENLTTSVTISGTVGAALQGAASGAPAMAISLEMPVEFFETHSTEIDFSVAAHFTTLFARKLIKKEHFNDVDMLKVDVPCDATPQTPWRVTRLSRHPYYIPVVPRRVQLEDAAPIDYEIVLNEETVELDSDVYALRVERQVSVSPLSLDLTSRVDLVELEQRLRAERG